MLEPQTAYILAAITTFLNSLVLGYLRRDLPHELRPAARTWQIGFVLQAAAYYLFSLHNKFPFEYILPVANSLFLFGITGYWRALRQFHRRKDNWYLLMPATLGVLAIIFFTIAIPSFGMRVGFGSAAASLVLASSAATIAQHRREPPPRSHLLLIAVFGVSSAFLFLRAVLGFFVVPEFENALSPSKIQTWSAFFMLAMPVAVTTCFLLMCSEKIRRQLERAVSTDYLTGCLSRRSITEAIERAIEKSRSEGSQVSIALLDIDYFKRINDLHGHPVGDQVLISVVAAIMGRARTGDLVGRIGGEEFIILMEGADIEAATKAAERLRQTVSEISIKVEAYVIKITASIGVACLDADELSFDQFFLRADKALYQSKLKGRNLVSIADAAINPMQ